LDEISKVQDENDEMLRRIDSDAKAIQITTMHASKGLEYPIVLVPYPKRANTMGAEVYTYGGQRFVNAAQKVSWTVDDLNAATRTAFAIEEIEGDELRLMYVAFTRAKHQLVVWWAKSQGIDKSSLARLLFGDPEDITKPTKALDGEDARKRLNQLQTLIGVDDSGEQIMQLVELRIDDTTVVPLKDSGEAVALGGKSAVFPRNAVQDWNWKRWSFSSLASSLKHDYSDTHKGGSDEGEEGVHPVSNEVASSADGVYSGVGLFSMPADAEFGTLVHEVLEKVNFTSPTLLNDLSSTIAAYDSETLRGIDVEELATGLHGSLLTPLEPMIPGFRFADLNEADRLAEMDFHFSLPGDSASAVEIALAAAADSDSMFSSYFEQLAQTWSSEYGRDITGIMTGSIDVLFRTTIDERFKYYVVDYKSNKLHGSGNVVHHHAYEFDSMKNAMEKSHYPLQALFYCVALHRFMTHRVPDYDIDRDLGGAAYLFVRGMVGVDTPVVNGIRNGVLAWRPSTQTILAVDAILGGAVS
jgi:exodeoxyribonuclease V beta subunit